MHVGEPVYSAVWNEQNHSDPLATDRLSHALIKVAEYLL
jgi:hypothetical protein